MPELPEVENVVQTLRQLVLNQTIRSVIINPSGYRLIGQPIDEFLHSVTNNSIVEVIRIGKYIVIKLSHGAYLVVHLRMTGKFIFQQLNGHSKAFPQVTLESSSSNDKHTRVIFELTNGTLKFLDKRRFATLHLINDLSSYPSLVRLGPDALQPQFTWDNLYSRAQKTDKPIYTLLLDQTVVAGLGNIYVCEVLANCKIHPLSKSRSIPMEEVQRIHGEIVRLLKVAIILKGTTFSDFVDTYGQKGGYQEHLTVYGKTITQINGVDYKVGKIKIAGRTAHYIPDLQQLFTSKSK